MTAPAAEISFTDFDVREEIVSALAAKGITTPFPIQAETLPIALGGHDIIGQAKTGTGKTLGFGIPALERVIGPHDPGFDLLRAPGSAQALIVTPTRELANQVADDLTAAAKNLSVRIATIYGGRAYEPQIEELHRGVEIIVGTPGRLIDLNRQKYLNLSNVGMVVLDEADEMLDLGFLPDVENLLSQVPAVRQTLLFSATMPGPVINMARRYMSRPTHINAADPDDIGTLKKDIRQLVYRAHQLDKDEIIARILQATGRGRTIIFTRTKRQADKLAEELKSRGFSTGALHGDLNQAAREKSLAGFRSGAVDVLVATDVAARGIDVTDVTHVINFSAPEDDKTYVHRIGRTGRAGQKGTAVTFVDWEDVPRWKLINQAIGTDFPEPVETYSSSPHLFEDLDIPAGTKGRLKTQAPAKSQGTAKSDSSGQTPNNRSKGRRRNGSGSKNSSRPRNGSASKNGVDSQNSTDSHSSGAGNGTESQRGAGSHNAAGSEPNAGADGSTGRPRRRRRRKTVHGEAE